MEEEGRKGYRLDGGMEEPSYLETLAISLAWHAIVCPVSTQTPCQIRKVLCDLFHFVLFLVSLLFFHPETRKNGFRALLM